MVVLAAALVAGPMLVAQAQTTYYTNRLLWPFLAAGAILGTAALIGHRAGSGGVLRQLPAPAYFYPLYAPPQPAYYAPAYPPQPAYSAPPPQPGITYSYGPR